jgi:hypothetical protein
LYRVFNDDYDYDYPPPPSSLVDEIQAQHQLPTPARILSAPALQIRSAGVEDDAAAAAAAAVVIEVVERLN